LFLVYKNLKNLLGVGINIKYFESSYHLHPIFEQFHSTVFGLTPLILQYTFIRDLMSYSIKQKF